MSDVITSFTSLFGLQLYIMSIRIHIYRQYINIQFKISTVVFIDTQLDLTYSHHIT